MEYATFETPLRWPATWERPDQNGRRVVVFKGLDCDGRASFRIIPDWKLHEGARRD